MKFFKNHTSANSSKQDTESFIENMKTAALYTS